jgi:hypothetical protein
MLWRLRAGSSPWRIGRVGVTVPGWSFEMSFEQTRLRIAYCYRFVK